MSSTSLNSSLSSRTSTEEPGAIDSSGKGENGQASATKNTSPMEDQSKACPRNNSGPNLAAMAEEHAKTEAAKSYIDTKEGQDHIRICIPKCPYRVLQAEKDEAVEGERLRKVATKEEEETKGGRHFTPRISPCPVRVESGSTGTSDVETVTPLNPAWDGGLKGSHSIVGTEVQSMQPAERRAAKADSNMLSAEGERKVSER